MTSTHKIRIAWTDAKKTGKRIAWSQHSSYPEHQEIAVVTDGEVVLEINVEEIVQKLGRKALLSKSGKAVEIGGLVSVKRVSSREVSREDQPIKPLPGSQRYL